MICITKTGTRTFEKAVQDLFPDEDQSFFTKQYENAAASRVKKVVKRLYGYKVSENCTFLAHIREPVERYLSALNHRWGETDLSLDQAIEKSFINIADLTFIPQTFWMNCPERQQKLFLSQGDLMRFLGHQGEVPHLNKSIKKWSLKELKSHPDFTIIKERYLPDYKLYERAVKENENV